MSYYIKLLICFVSFILFFEIQAKGFKPLVREDATPQEVNNLFLEEKEAKKKIIEEQKRIKKMEEKLQQAGVIRRQIEDIVAPFDTNQSSSAKTGGLSERKGSDDKSKGLMPNTGSSVRREPVYPASIQQKTEKEISLDKEQEGIVSTEVEPTHEGLVKESKVFPFIIAIILIVTTICLIREFFKVKSKK